MTAPKTLARFLAVPSEDDDNVQLTIEAEDGSTFSVNATAEQVEDIIDTLDMLFGEDDED
ncbi:hypothetical protein [Terrihabitans rhizophilus]|jgi:copper(I)-binding protein|uniref:Uncharacterized protein n=1 Tax=Terrihabitans rhizophilus TaxID=3092662 RepID=A0ABU4RPR9_9HYPH|nr:hypothetical protein [Terrihabitans sp. PJ23]MDX6806841.1 hypothetical protein [Terrihabitans sp. PJ23]